MERSAPTREAWAPPFQESLIPINTNTALEEAWLLQQWLQDRQGLPHTGGNLRNTLGVEEGSHLEDIHSPRRCHLHAHSATVRMANS